MCDVLRFAAGARNEYEQRHCKLQSTSGTSFSLTVVRNSIVADAPNSCDVIPVDPIAINNNVADFDIAHHTASAAAANIRTDDINKRAAVLSNGDSRTDDKPDDVVGTYYETALSELAIAREVVTAVIVNRKMQSSTLDEAGTDGAVGGRLQVSLPTSVITPSGQCKSVLRSEESSVEGADKQPTASKSCKPTVFPRRIVRNELQHTAVFVQHL
jgi:hypothetical protein